MCVTNYALSQNKEIDEREVDERSSLKLRISSLIHDFYVTTFVHKM